MMRHTFITRTLFTLFFLLLCFPLYAQAYLDPGAGSMVIQVLMAGVAGVIAFVKLYGKQAFSALKKMFSNDKNG